MQSSGYHFNFETPDTKLGEDQRQGDSGYHEEERLHSTPRYFTDRARRPRPTKLEFSSEKQKRIRGAITVTHFYLKLVQFSIREGFKIENVFAFLNDNISF